MKKGALSFNIQVETNQNQVAEIGETLLLSNRPDISNFSMYR